MKKSEYLKIYEQSKKLVTDINSAIKKLPKQEIDGLLAQINMITSMLFEKIEAGLYINSSDSYVKQLSVAYDYLTRLYCLIHIFNNVNLTKKSIFEDVLDNLIKTMDMIYCLRKLALKKCNSKTAYYTIIAKN